MRRVNRSILTKNLLVTTLLQLILLPAVVSIARADSNEAVPPPQEKMTPVDACQPAL
jgi:hypothetical protein